MKELEDSDSKLEGASKKLDAMLEVLTVDKEKNFVEGWKVGIDALDLATKIDSRSGMAQAHEGLATVLWKLAEYSQSIQHFESALDKFLGMGDLYGVARCYCGMGIISATLEEYRTALEYFEDGLSASRRSARYQLAATITSNIGHVYFNFGRYDEAMKCFKRGLEYYDQIEQPHGEANMIGGMAGVHVYLGEYDKGLELAEKALNLHKKAGQTRGIAVSMMNIGNVFYRKGKLELAKTEFKTALNYATSINLKMSVYEVLKSLSSVCSDLGQEEESAKYLKLYMDGQKEENKLSVNRKNEHFKQRQIIRKMQSTK
ncbi:MAG: tetratricopeptide (TPR) repeat protein [Bacteroidia bacterium]|jgi:tetratricopeptide (TPR) repeat protein